MSESTLVETARFEALHGSAIGCAGLVKNLADAVAALTAENERLTQENADLRSFYDHVTGWAERRLAARAALPSTRETT